MFASSLAAFFFALNATCAHRSIQASGAVRANLGRLMVAVVVLGLYSHLLGQGFGSTSTRWYLLSGVIGMGLGDLALYRALPLLGSRLTVLMTQCLAAPIAALGEWLWLGTHLTGAQVTWGLLILGGVALALLPGRAETPRARAGPISLLFGLAAAIGQGLGALVSRKGADVAALAGEITQNATFGINAAYHRILAGLVFTALWFAALHLGGRLTLTRPAPGAPGAIRPRAHFWMLANGLIGPVLGVGCYQWALASTPSGLVLPIVATTPLMALPLTYWLDGERPSRRSFIGGIVAVGAAVALTQV